MLLCTILPATERERRLSGLLFDDGIHICPAAEAAGKCNFGKRRILCPGDFNRVSAAEVEKLMNGDSSGRVQR